MRVAENRDDASGLDLSVYEGLARFRLALRRFLAFSEAASREAGVTPSQYQAMLAIRTHRDGTMPIRDLAAEMLLRHHGAVQLVDRLARAGLAERRPSAVDRRQVLVLLTDKGNRLLEQLASAHAAELLRQEPLLAESVRRLRDIGP
jgi:DNA-binding MarR family transcriptional regulator